MKRRTPIADIMTKDIITLDRTDDLERAEELFKRYNIRHIPVVNDEAIVGMLSYTDLLKISFADVTDDDLSVNTVVYNMFSIEQVMTKSLVCVDSSTTIREVAEILACNEFHALPVVDKNILVGIVTTTDLINYLLMQF